MGALQIIRVGAGLEPPRPGAIAAALATPVLGFTACAAMIAAAVGDVGLVIAVAVACLAAPYLALAWPPGRRALASWAARRQVAARRRARRGRMRLAHGDHRAEHEELTRRLDEIERIDPIAVDDRLDDVLDDYVELAIACERTARATNSIDPSSITGRLSRLEQDDSAPRALRELHRGVLEHRARRHAECTRSIATMRARLAMIGDYVRLVSERLAPGVPPEHRVDELVADLGRLEAAEMELELAG